MNANSLVEAPSFRVGSLIHFMPLKNTTFGIKKYRAYDVGICCHMKYHIIFDRCSRDSPNYIRQNLYTIISNLAARHFYQNFNKTLFADREFREIMCHIKYQKIHSA